MTSTKYQKVRYQGVLVDRYTLQAFVKANVKFIARYGFSMTIVQGSYNAGGVSASAGTHDGGGVLDIRTWNMTTSQRIYAVKCLRYYGFAAWYRYPPSFDEHIHAVQLGNEKASRGAKNQVTAYYNKRDGLAGNRSDSTWRPKKIRPFKYVEPKKPAKKPSKATPAVDKISISAVRTRALDNAAGRKVYPHDDVRDVAALLNKLDRQAKTKLRLDGIWDDKVEAAYRSFEKVKGYKQDDGIPDASGVGLRALVSHVKSNRPVTA